MKTNPKIDNHHPAISKLLILASLFDGVFSIDWLQEISGARASEIFSAIEAGVSEGILAQKEAGMIFFTKDEHRQQYRTMLAPDSARRYHEAIARLILEGGDTEASALTSAAPHLLQIQNGPEGCQWLLKAGDIFSSAYRYMDALACYKKVLLDISGDKAPEAARIYAETAISYSRISDAEADLGEVITVLKTALKKLTKKGDPAQRARMEMHLAKNKWLLSQFNAALKHFTAAQSIAAKCDDAGLRRSMASFVTFFLFVQGRLKDVIQHYEEFLPVVEKYPKNRFPMLSATVVGISYAATGQITQGMGMLDAIDAHARSKGNDYVASFTAYAIGVLLTMLGGSRVEEAISYFQAAIEMGERAPNHTPIAASMAYLASIYSRKGEPKKAATHYRRFLELNRTIKIDRSAIPCFLDLGWLVEQGHLPPLDELSFDIEIDRAIKARNIAMRGTGYRYRSMRKKIAGEPIENIMEDLNQSLKWLNEAGSFVEAAVTRFEIARIHLQQGDERSARDQMQLAVNPIDAAAMDIVPKDLLPLVGHQREDKRLLEEIMSLSQDLVSIRDHRELVRKIISTAIHITGAERGAIFTSDPDTPGTQPILQAAKNMPAEDVASKDFEPSLKIIRKTFETGTGCIQPTGMASDHQTIPGKSIRHCTCIPMQMHGKVVGVLYFDNRLLSCAFKESDLNMLNYFAALAAIAMDNAVAYEKIQSLNEKLSEEKKYYREQHLECIHFEEFVGKSRAIMQVLSNVQDVAETVSNVLILGETGVGKELVARSIHRLSLRKGKPFIRVNCSAFPESLIASELFGYEKGAFTGATIRRHGRFELANKGTLFLDEIGDIPLEVQVRLLRVLQSKEFERLGGKETIRSDFRLIAATNRDLDKAVASGTFREDLFYRLNVFPIYVPPLRERRDDIPLLVQYFLDIYRNKMGKPQLKISNSDMDLLLMYDWPGNVRELENLIERGTILSSGERFVMPELSKSPLLHPHEPTAQKEAVTLRDNERNHILWALKVTDGKIRGKDGAAELLDIHPNTLYGRMRKLGIARSKS